MTMGCLGCIYRMGYRPGAADPPLVFLGGRSSGAGGRLQERHELEEGKVVTRFREGNLWKGHSHDPRDHVKFGFSDLNHW